MGGIGPWGGAALGFGGGFIVAELIERHREQQMMVMQRNQNLYQDAYGSPYGNQYGNQYGRPPINPAFMTGDPRLAYYGQRPGQFAYSPDAYGQQNYGQRPPYDRYAPQNSQYRDILPPSPLDQDNRRETQDLADKLLCNPPDVCGVMNHLRILGMLDKQNKQEHPNDPNKQTHLWYSEYLAVRDLVHQESQGQMDFNTPYQAGIGQDGKPHRVFTLSQNGRVIADSNPVAANGRQPYRGGNQNTPDYEGTPGNPGNGNGSGNRRLYNYDGSQPEDNGDTPAA
jgi:hypothetical protein